jgi:SAM-dependent methyltransferase
MPNLRRKLAGAREVVRRHARRSGWLTLPSPDERDWIVKPPAYLPVYEELLSSLRFRACTILELGVYYGNSLQMWRDAFPRATIVGVDIAPLPGLEFGPRVHIERADQTDGEALERVCARYAPDGFDVIIDDASHMGVKSARSLQYLYRRHLKPGGLYIIEDWGTGYLPSWHDGGELSAPVGSAYLDQSTVTMTEDPRPIPMPSHDIGLVGVVKRLVDHVASTTLGAHQPELVQEPLEIDWLRVHDGIVILRKSRA